ncbi:hypothetical protein [Actinomadura sp. HBU206391]|uniref:hypothetical protein n=1 Tax=Actinomadura sp. HBU206391 TaxID=2731692 RepID=UPI00165039DA|nr:hypothetical protein [Actinomadura sp. HBU206391]MBC6459214.1 hypothetical protein [Actinomadura sp. HBU206391]
MRMRRLALALVLPAVLALAACGGGEDGDGVASAGGGEAKNAAASPSQSLSPEDAQLKFAQCMRENGVEMADPESGGGVRIQVTGKPGSREKTEAAMKKCRPYLEAGGKMPNMQDPKVRDQFVKFAQCMRENGVNMQDPGPDGGLRIQGKPGEMGREKLEKARKACESLRPGGGQK